ncbi:hypothetical protein [Rhizobium jaguaris]|uniref:hypothetical protein n=1 Tax=Rhizobium jaguaris TaxID=1312183 RepID=UPI0013C4F319|nr:hypothetical protein [Rhizobium jaguaris]
MASLIVRFSDEFGQDYELFAPKAHGYDIRVSEKTGFSMPAPHDTDDKQTH